jgi:hypothetical protein
MNIGIGSGDGNSIFEIAAKYEKMQLREMRKNIETIKQGLRSGADTGSIKFLDDMEKLSGLVLQLKVKTGFIVDDDLEPLFNDEIEKAKIELRYEDDILQTIGVKVIIKQMELNQPDQPPARIGIAQYDTWFKDIKAKPDDQPIYKFLEVLAFKQVYLDKFVPSASRKKDDYTLYRSVNAEIDRLKSLIKLNLNTTKIMSTSTFEKLNTISDTIPNIINQILSLALGISKIVVTKITEWSTEITNEDLSKVIDTSNELIEDVALINSKAGIQPYITIYKKLKKPIEDIHKSVNEMGKLAGVISYDDNVKNQFKYTNTIGFTNRTGPRPLVPGAAPSTRLAPPVPPAPPIILIKKLIDKLENLFKAGIVPGFDSKVGDSLEDLGNILINESIITSQTDPLVSSMQSLANASAALAVLPIGSIPPDTVLGPVVKTLNMMYKSIQTIYYNKPGAQPTGASGVGETKGAGKFMHSYHAKRFL